MAGQIGGIFHSLSASTLTDTDVDLLRERSGIYLSYSNNIHIPINQGSGVLLIFRPVVNADRCLQFYYATYDSNLYLRYWNGTVWSGDATNPSGWKKVM